MIHDVVCYPVFYTALCSFFSVTGCALALAKKQYSAVMYLLHVIYCIYVSTCAHLQWYVFFVFPLELVIGVYLNWLVPRLGVKLFVGQAGIGAADLHRP